MIYNITKLIDMSQLRLLCKVVLLTLFFCGFMLKLFESTWLKYIEKKILKTKIEDTYIKKTDILYKRIFTILKSGQYICLIKNKYYLVEISTFLFNAGIKIKDIPESEVEKLSVSNMGFERVN